jgi:uracil-DNA glycosylase
MSVLTSSDLEPSWRHYLAAEFEQDCMQQLKAFLQQEKALSKIIYPSEDDVFNAFNSTKFDDVRVVILGQDPYHGPNQAHGLCFSVQKDVRLPPSLLNIFKEIQRDLDIKIPSHGCLQSWAAQGVLLLNATLTVEQSAAGSHQGKGWEHFTDKAVQHLNAHREGVIFLLWGSYAQKKGRFIDQSKHVVLTSVHPSPLSAYRGFIGCGHFSAVNERLVNQGLEPIDWCVDH